MALSDDLRKRVVEAVVLGGLSRNAAARRFGVSIASLEKIGRRRAMMPSSDCPPWPSDQSAHVGRRSGQSLSYTTSPDLGA